MKESSDYNKMKEDEIDFQYYLKLLKRYRVVASIVFILIFGAILAFTFLSSPTYEAKSLVAISSQDQTSFLLGSSVPKVSDLETQTLIIQGTSVMGDVYEQYGIDKFELSVSILKNSNVIEITVTTNNAERAALIANAVAESYVKYTRDVRTQDANAVIDFVDEQIALYDSEFDALNKEILTYEALGKNMTTKEKLKYQAALREQSAKNKVYDSLLSKREEARLIISLDSGNVNIIGYAEIPTIPIAPNIPLNILLGFILASVAALGSALVIDKI
jgi:uncharacterized protein involved in exopolysaccharide biosynthesis